MYCFRIIKLFIYSIIFFKLISCENDPFINFPKIIDPNYITYTNYLSDGNILNAKLNILNKKKIISNFSTKKIINSLFTNKKNSFNGNISTLYESKNLKININVSGIVLNNYDSNIHKIRYDKGFYIQDNSNAIFVRGKDKIKVKQGDLVQIKISELYRRICKKCNKKKTGQLQIKNYSDLKIISSKNSIYCKKISAPIKKEDFIEKPICIQIKGKISYKSTLSTLGMDNNNWAIFIKRKSDRNKLDNFKVGDTLIAYGMFDAYNYLIAGGKVKNYYPLYIFNVDKSIINLNKFSTQTLKGVVINDYNSNIDKINNFNGFFIQDSLATIFIRITDFNSGIKVNRGNLIKINAKEYKKSKSGQIYVNNIKKSNIKIISKNNKIFCKKINYSNISKFNSQFVKIRGIISYKKRKNSSFWGMENNLWIIRFPIKTERNFPNIYEKNEIIAYGIMDFYDGPSLNFIKNKYMLWVYDAKNSIINLRIQ